MPERPPRCFIISAASSNHLHLSLVKLLCELHTYYNPGKTADHELVHTHLLTNLLSPESPHQLVIATDEDDTVIGLAAISLVFSLVEPHPDQRRHCQLKELYVREDHRSQGVGHALMRSVAHHAWSQGCRRIDWPVQARNRRGIHFYERLGAHQRVDRLSYRIHGHHLEQLAQQFSP